MREEIEKCVYCMPETRCCTYRYGTMEELLEMVTWQQLGYHAKPVGLLNVDGYYDHLLAFFDTCVEKVRLHSSVLRNFARFAGERVDVYAWHVDNITVHVS